MNSIMNAIVFILMFLIFIVAISVDGKHKRKNPSCDSSSPSSNTNRTSDFDFLQLRISWIPSMCYSFRKSHINILCKNLDKNNQWAIHGLWPTSIHKPSPKFCNCASKYDPSIMINLETELEAKWTNIEKENDSVFWEHEYFKHGTCVSTVDQVNTQFKYFNESLKIFGKYNISQLFKDANIRLGSRYKRNDIIEGVNKKLGKRIGLTCKREKKIERYFLASVGICFDKSMNLIDCIDSSSHPNNCPPSNTSSKIEFSDMEEMMKRLESGKMTWV